MKRIPGILLAFVIAARSAAGLAEAPGTGVPSILVTRQLAEARHLSTGDVVRLSNDPSGKDPRTFRIAGVYEPVPDPMRLTAKRWEARMHLGDLLGMTADPADPAAAEEVSAIHLASRNRTDLPRLQRAIAARAPGVLVAASDLPEGADPFRVLERFHVAISIVAVFGSTAFLLALMVIRAEERREVAGILRLVGFPRGKILRQVLVEGIAVAGAGAVFGVVLAMATQGIVNAFFQWHYDTALVFVRVTPGLAVQCVLVAVPLGAVAGFVASWSLLRREVVDLLRR